MADSSWAADVSPSPGVPKPDPTLVVEDVRRSFGGLVAVDVDKLQVQRGSITALIGPNGAGKTTLFNLLTGFDQPDSGDWAFDGVDLQGKPAHAIARSGMVRTFQLTKTLSRMTVLDNMRMAAPHQQGERLSQALLPPRWRARERELEARALQTLERFRLREMHDEYAATLSGGQRKLLEMARAVMTEPRLVLLDEPVAGVNPVLKQALLDHVRELRAEDTTVLFVEHDMDVVMGISDWIVCMAEGRVISEGRPRQVAADPAVVDAYLGTHRSDQSGSATGEPS